MLMRRSSGYDRSKILERAAAARAKGRYKKAIELYGQVLENEPDNPELHRKLAPLYVKAKRASDALASYQVAAEALVREAFEDQAIGLLRGAVAELPQESILWQSIAELELKRGRRPDAVGALVQGRRHLRRRRQRPQAIELLRRAHAVDPTHFEVAYDLAGLLGRTGKRATALRLLRELAARPDRKKLVRVRWLELRWSPGPRALGRLLRALLLRR